MRSRYFIALAFIAFGFGLVQLAMHQAQVQKLSAADQAGTDPAASQAALKAYTQAHMLTTTSVFLQGSYNRAVTAQQAAAGQANGSVYAQAQAACDQKGVDSIRQANCVQAYVAAHSQPQPNPQAVAAPNKADYTQAFRSPGWTADSVGLAWLTAVVSLVLAIYLRLIRRPRYL